MDHPTGKVVACHDRRVTVAVAAPVACRRCAAGRGCGAGMLLAGNAVRAIDADLPEGLTVNPGDHVALQLPPRDLLRAAWLAYGLPLAALVAAVAAGAALSGGNEPALVAWAVAGLLGGFAAGRRRLARGGSVTLTIARRLPPAERATGVVPSA